MSTFPLRIGTPDGLLFEGNVERVICRTVSGDLAILARHCNYCTALGGGWTNGQYSFRISSICQWYGDCRFL